MIPNYPRKWFLLIISVVALTLTAALPYCGISSPWKGTWWSIDVDGSLQKVVFGGGSQVRFNYFDWGATVCGIGADGSILYAGQASGDAETVTATSFEGSAPGICKAHPPFDSFTWHFIWTYDPATDTLWDGNNIWTRTRP